MSLDVDLARSRAVLLGVSFFPRDPERLPPLPAVRNNLRDLERALADPAILGLDARHITVVDDRPSSEMLSKLVEVADEAEDTLIVYYAGHGVPGSASLYLTGTDSSERTIEFDGMPFDRLRLALNTSPARKKVLILDCCYSGRAIDVMGTADAMLQASIEDLEGTYTLASSGATEASAAPAGERCTAFTGELLRVLHEGIADAPQTLKLNEIFRALRLALRRNPKFPEPRQAAKGTAGDIDFVHNRAWRPQTMAPEPEPTPAGAPATGPTSDWQKELAERLDRQAQLIEALQRQVQERSAAQAEKLAHTSAAQGLADERMAPEKGKGGHEERFDSDETYAEMLEMQKARIAELETALAELQRPPPPSGSFEGRSKPPMQEASVGERVGYALAASSSGLFRFQRRGARKVAASLETDSGAAASGSAAAPTPEPRHLGFAARIFILLAIVSLQAGFLAFLVDAFPGGPSNSNDQSGIFVFSAVAAAVGLVVWKRLRTRYAARNPIFCWLALPFLIGLQVGLCVAVVANV